MLLGRTGENYTVSEKYKQVLFLKKSSRQDLRSCLFFDIAELNVTYIIRNMTLSNQR